MSCPANIKRMERMVPSQIKGAVECEKKREFPRSFIARVSACEANRDAHWVGERNLLPRLSACSAGKSFSLASGIVLLAAGFLWMAAGSVDAGERKESLLANGDFETADETDPARPARWFSPDGLGIQWTNDASSVAHGKCIRMDTTVSERAMVEQWTKAGLTNFWNIPKPAANAIAETYGLSYYSDAMPVQTGQAYRVTFDFKGASGGKLWVRCYGEFEGQKRTRYEKVVECKRAGNEWTTLSAVFHPTRQRPEVSEMKVMLFAYYPAGIYWFDNVRIEPISDEEYQRLKSEPPRKRQ